MFTYVNNDTSKFYWLIQGSTFFNVLVMHPSNGSYIESKIVTSSSGDAVNTVISGGRFSESLMLIHYTLITGAFRDYLTFLNVDDWTATSYVQTNIRFLSGFSTVFGTNEIMLLFAQSNPNLDYSIQTDYDKLNLTQMYTE